MCGICGIFDITGKKRIKKSIIKKMTGKLLHRGPDGVNQYVNGNIALGFSRLSIIDLEGGMQPLLNETGSVILICNGEIFNYIELQEELVTRGHTFKTRTDVEVILHLYEEMGIEFLNRLNGQFAFALFDFRSQQLFCARDHFGIIPFFYMIVEDFFIFASEIKSLLEHPAVKKEVDPVGLDHIFSFPGLVDPQTMFKDIRSLPNGHYIKIPVKNNKNNHKQNIKSVEYWDLIYPPEGESRYEADEGIYIQRLNEGLTRSVKLRLRSDVPVGLYISGGLDSSLVAAKTLELTPGIRRLSFSIDFEEKDKSESKYQRQIANYINSIHTEQLFFYTDISRRLTQAVYHAEYPLKETYNTASLALSEAAHSQGIKVVLTGEGADEWFAGYPGYKFDKFRKTQQRPLTRGEYIESELCEKKWGDRDLWFEMNQHNLSKIKRELYSEAMNRVLADSDSLKTPVINKDRLHQRHILHKRSYLDYKLRLVSHLVSDHGDRMAYANSVEARYPFLDKELVEFAATIPPGLKLKQFKEKYILKKLAEPIIPEEIIRREKFAFHAPGSPYLLKRDIQYINDLISFETIKKQGFFNPHQVENLKRHYTRDGFRLNIPYESDLLITVITFGIFLEVFQIPGMN